MYFAVVGLRAASAVPVDLDANWPLRMRQLQVRTSAAATRMFLVILGVLPITACAVTVAAWLWGASVAVALGLLQLVAGAFLVEIVLSSWTTVPFASAHEPAVTTLRSRWSWHAGAVLFFGYALAGIEAASLPLLIARNLRIDDDCNCPAAYVALGPQAESTPCCSSEAHFRPYQNTRLSRYDAVS